MQGMPWRKPLFASIIIGIETWMRWNVACLHHTQIFLKPKLGLSKSPHSLLSFVLGLLRTSLAKCQLLTCLLVDQLPFCTLELGHIPLSVIGVPRAIAIQPSNLDLELALGCLSIILCLLADNYLSM